MNETLTVDIILLGAYTIYDRNLIYQCKSLDKSRKTGYNINAR